MRPEGRGVPGGGGEGRGGGGGWLAANTPRRRRRRGNLNEGWKDGETSEAEQRGHGAAASTVKQQGCTFERSHDASEAVIAVDGADCVLEGLVHVLACHGGIDLAILEEHLRKQVPVCGGTMRWHDVAPARR